MGFTQSHPNYQILAAMVCGLFSSASAMLGIEGQAKSTCTMCRTSLITVCVYGFCKKILVTIDNYISQQVVLHPEQCIELCLVA